MRGGPAFRLILASGLVGRVARGSLGVSARLRSVVGLSGVGLCMAGVLPCAALAGGTGAIEGSITNVATGAPIEEIEVCVTRIGVDGKEEGSACAANDPHGRYRIENLASGSYRVWFSTANTVNFIAQYYSGQSTSEDADLVSVSAGSTTSAINAEMVEGGMIGGRVTDLLGGAPIKGIQVCTRIPAWEFGAEQRCGWSNSEGDYTITGLPAGSYDVAFIGEPEFGANYVGQFYPGVSEISEASAVTVTLGAVSSAVDAQMEEAGSMSGKVVDWQTKRPLSMVEICVSYMVNGVHEDCVYTNEHGEYKIWGLKPTSYRVAFSDREAGYLGQYYNHKELSQNATPVPVTAGAKTSNVDAELSPGGAITGTVIEAQTKTPIEGLLVCAYEAGSEREARCEPTNAAGEYSLGEMLSGSYEVEFRGLHGDPTQYYAGVFDRAEARSVTVDAGQTTQNIDAEMIEPGGRISGVVTTAATKAPLEGVRVCALNASGSLAGPCASTDAGGSYTLKRLLPGSYSVEFTLFSGEHEYLRQFYDNEYERSEADHVTVTFNHTTENIDAAMNEGGQIGGKVTDALTGDALERIHVCAVPVKPGFEASGGCASTNSKGQYTITHLQPRSYRVQFVPQGRQARRYLSQYYDNSETWEGARPVSVGVGELTGGIDGKLNEGGGLSGTVSSAATGARLQGIEVCALRGRERPEGSCAQTGKKGGYTIAKLRSGSYTVEFSGEAGGVRYRTQFYNGKSIERDAYSVDVRTGAIQQGIDARMAKAQAGAGTSTGTASVIGAIRMSRGEVRVTLRCERPSRCAGTLRLFAIAKHNRRVDGHAVQRVSAVLIGEGRFAIRRGTQASVLIRLTGAGRTLAGRASERGLPVRIGGRHLKIRALVLRRRAR